MGTAADAAKDFVAGPLAIEAGRRLLERFPLAALVEALGTAPPPDAEVLLEALERLADLKEVRDAFLADASFAAFLSQGAASPAPRIRRLVAQLVARLSLDAAGAPFLADKAFLTLVEDLLLDSETGTGEAVAKALCNATALPGPYAAIVGGDGEDSFAQRLLERLPSLPDVQRIRALHLFIALGRASPGTFAALERRGCYKEAVGAFLTEDILLKLNAVELMDALSAFEAGQDFLATSGFPERLARELVDPMNDASVRVCVLHLLGVVLMRSSSALGALLPSQEAPLAQTFVEFLESRDATEKLTALNAWSHIAVHAGGLSFFLRWPAAMRTIVAALASHHQEVCKGAMACWASLLEHWAEPMQVDSNGVSDNSPTQLWEIAEREIVPMALKNLRAKPFPEAREQTWRLLAALVRSKSAARQALSAEETRDLLLDFKSETKAAARIAKHNFVCTIVNQQGDLITNFLDEGVGKLLREYSRQGPHWQPREAQVDVADMGA